MTPPSNRSFRIVISVGWLVLAAAALVYASLKGIPTNIAVPLAMAFLVEYPFYLLPGFETARNGFVARGKARAAAIFAVGAIAPWLIYTISTGHFDPLCFCLLCVIALVMCFWYVILPAHPAADVVYLALFGALLVFKVFLRLYPRPMPRLDVSVLGHLMLIRVAAFSLIAIRGTPASDYRFFPSRNEFLAGLRWFAAALPVTALAYWALGLVKLRAQPLNILVVVASFFGILWVVSLSEEFIFRGLLQPWIADRTSRPLLAVLLTSLLFGSVHLGFHGAFPNWRFSIVAAILGMFCGLARRQTGGIQAGMVTHALIVAIWMMFLQ
jgi:membrane protease YdiL (CAAX protease family)